MNNRWGAGFCQDEFRNDLYEKMLGSYKILIYFGFVGDQTQDSSNSEFQVKYDIPSGEINVNTLLKSLAALSTAIDEIGSEIGGGQKIEIRIKAVKKNSFEININLIASKIADMISDIDWDVPFKIVSAFASILTIRKLLKGENPKNIEATKDSVAITAESGNRIVVDNRTFNLYNNITINEAISDHFESLDDDPTIDSFEIQDMNKNQLFVSNRDDFEKLIPKGIEEPEERKSTDIKKSITLNMYRLVWDKGHRWGFYYQGTRISATITDNGFLEKIEKGEVFAKGDSLIVDLQIKQVFNEAANTYVNESYNIIKVYKHIHRPVQGSLNV